MELRQLAYFAAVVEEGTVTGAARTLNMTQPPLTAQLHALESELGCHLFVHEGRRLRLTQAGSTFYERTRAILGLCDAAADEMHDYHAGLAGTLRLGVVSSVAGELLLGLLGPFAAAYPAVTYDLSAGNTYQLLEQVRTGQIDLALVRTPFSAPELNCLTLKSEPMLAVGRPALFAGISGKNLSLSALSALPLIVYRRWESILRGRFEAAGCTMHIACRNEDAQTTLLLARGGFGVAVVPASALPETETALTAKTISDAGLASDIVMVCREEKLLPQCARRFRAGLAAKKAPALHNSFT